MKWIASLPVVCAGLLLPTLPALAGVFFMGTEADDQGDLIFSTTHPSYTIEYSSSQLAVDGQQLVATTEEDFNLATNTSSCAEYLLLPAGAELLEVTLTLGGRTEMVDLSGKVVGRVKYDSDNSGQWMVSEIHAIDERVKSLTSDYLELPPK